VQTNDGDCLLLISSYIKLVRRGYGAPHDEGRPKSYRCVRMSNETRARHVRVYIIRGLITVRCGKLGRQLDLGRCEMYLVRLCIARYIGYVETPLGDWHATMRH
jgi:hypothetical protein